MRLVALAQAGQLQPTRLYLVRHGQVAEGHTSRYHGNNDVGLSPLGMQQLEKLAEQLQEAPLDRCPPRISPAPGKGPKFSARAVPVHP